MSSALSERLNRVRDAGMRAAARRPGNQIVTTDVNAAPEQQLSNVVSAKLSIADYQKHFQAVFNLVSEHWGYSVEDKDDLLVACKDEALLAPLMHMWMAECITYDLVAPNGPSAAPELYAACLREFKKAANALPGVKVEHMPQVGSELDSTESRTFTPVAPAEDVKGEVGHEQASVDIAVSSIAETANTKPDTLPAAESAAKSVAEAEMTSAASTQQSAQAVIEKPKPVSPMVGVRKRRGM